MTGLVSTIPGAVQTLTGYMTAVASQYPDLNIGVYTGQPISAVANNFMMVGHYEDGSLITEAKYAWAGMPVTSKVRYEEYALQGTIRAWTGSNDPSGTIANAFLLSDALQEQIVSDPGGSGTISPSGSWGEYTTTMEACGPLDGRGWGVVLAFTLEVLNVRLIG